MLYIDSKYANLIRPYVRNYRHKGGYLWNFSCPYCGDSKKRSSLARGYIYRKNSDLFYNCKNCDMGTTFKNLLKFLNEQLYKEYTLETYRDSKASTHIVTDGLVEAIYVRPELSDNVLKGLRCITALPDDHPAVRYVKKRMIPHDKWYLIYYAPKFKGWTNRVKQYFSSPISGEHPRLVLPFFNNHGKVFGFAARAFGSEEPKYYNLKIDDTYDLIYGLERVDYSKRVYAFEGQIDSLFIDNSIAVAGASFDTKSLECIRSNLTFVIDNEPRNPQICDILKNVIDDGFSVCMFPDTIPNKDINEMITDGGMTVEEVKKLIDDNTFSGVAAKLRYTTWRKCDEVQKKARNR